MQTSTWLLLCLLSLLGPGAVLTKDAECSCLDLANVRRLIPEDAPLARELLYMVWEITEKDFCRSTFQTLPISTLGLAGNRRIGSSFVKLEDRSLGPFLKAWLKDKGIKRIVQTFFWQNWMNNKDVPHFIYLDRMINHTVDEIEKNFDSGIANMENFAESIFTKMKELFPNQDFFVSLHIEDVKSALKGLACTWTTHSRSFSIIDQLEAFQLDAFEQIMNTRGVEHLNIENTRKIAEHFKMVLIDEEVNGSIKNLLNKFRSLLQSFLPEIYNFQSLMSEIQLGKNIQFENIIIRILEEIETDRFFERMDTLFDHACQRRMDLLDQSLRKFLHTLEDFSLFAIQSFNDKNIMDVNKIVGLLTINKEKMVGMVGMFDNWLSGNTMVKVKEGKYTVLLIRYILDTTLLPQTSERKCKDDLQMFNEKAKVITAGAVQALLMNMHF